jgi:hypothetical protein
VSTAALGALEIRAVPICDVILPSQSHISDEEEFRFQMPVAVYGHGAGPPPRWDGLELGGYDLRLRRAVQLRLVNVGPRTRCRAAALGYPSASRAAVTLALRHEHERQPGEIS